MKNKKKKLILIIALFLGLVTITNYSNATETKVFITKETDKIIEGYIEIRPDEKEIQYDKLDASDLQSINSSTNVDTYYYNQLTHTTAKKVYTALKKDTTGVGVTTVTLANQVFSVNINSFNNDTAYRKDLLNKQIYGYARDGLVAFNDDNPQIYWYFDPKYDFSYNIDKSKREISFNAIRITSNIEEITDYKNFNQKVEEVVNSINGTSTYEIAKKCHDYICNTVTYTKKEDTNIDQTAYHALINQQGVCDAQARLFQLLCRRKGIACIRVNGYARIY